MRYSLIIGEEVFMSFINSEELTSNFLAEKREIVKAMKNIYADISRKVALQSASQIAITIISEESDQINSYIRKLPRRLKAIAADFAAWSGMSESAAEIVWANVMNTVGMPKAELCRTENINLKKQPSGESVRNSRVSTQKQELEKLKMNYYSGVAAAGAVAGIITCLVVPGFSGVVALIKSAELLVTGAGVAGAVTTKKKIDEINRIATDKSETSGTSGESKRIISEICNKQCELNTRLILKWVDSVCEELIVRCENELK